MVIRVGLVGYGLVAQRYHVPAMLSIPDVKVQAICEIRKDRQKRAKHEFRKANIYDSLGELLEKEESLDAVDICTPGFTHYDLCKQALESGVHVLVEKPLTLSLKEAQELKRMSESLGLKVCVMQTYRFQDNVIAAKKCYEEGKLGQITKAISIHHGRHIFNEAAWLWDQEKSGGILYELGIHQLDLQVYFCGEVKKIITVNKHFEDEMKNITALEAIISYQNGAIGIFDISQDTTLTSAQFSKLSIFGTGSDAFLKFFPPYLRISSGLINPLQEVTSELKRVMKFGSMVAMGRTRSQRIMPHKRIIQGFIESLTESCKVPVSIDDVLNTMRFLEMMKPYLKE